MVYMYLSKMWDNLYFLFYEFSSEERDVIIKNTSAMIFYFLIADKDKNRFELSINKYIKKLKIKKGNIGKTPVVKLNFVREKVLTEYRDFYRQKLIFLNQGLDVGNKKQTKLLKLDIELFKKNKIANDNAEYKKLFQEVYESECEK